MSKDFIVSFYIEGDEDTCFYAWLSQSSSRAEFGRGATIYEAISNLCRLLSDDELRSRASKELGCTCDACLNIIRKEIEIDAALRAAGYDPDEIGAQMKGAAVLGAALARVAPAGERDEL